MTLSTKDLPNLIERARNFAQSRETISVDEYGARKAKQLIEDGADIIRALLARLERVAPVAFRYRTPHADEDHWHYTTSINWDYAKDANLLAVEPLYAAPVAPVSDVGELVERLNHLVSLHEPKNGGPFGGYAADACIRAMHEAATTLTRLETALREIAEQDVIEIALDPDWPARIAKAALKASQ